MTTIALASDHAGYALKHHLVNYLEARGYNALDLGVHTADQPSDYPDAAALVADAILEGRAQRGILVCGSGVGVCIAANKHNGIYASVCHDTYSAHQGVEHDNMNVLVLGARIIGIALAEELATAFLKAHFSLEERHHRRFGKVQAIERANLS